MQVCVNWLSLNFLLTLTSLRFICIFSMQLYDWWWHSADLMIVFPFWFHSTDWSFDKNKHPTQFQHAKIYCLFYFCLIFNKTSKRTFSITCNGYHMKPVMGCYVFLFFSTLFFRKYFNWFYLLFRQNANYFTVYWRNIEIKTGSQLDRIRLIQCAY